MLWSWTMIHEHNEGATFDRSNMLQSKISREGSIGRDRQRLIDNLFRFPLVIHTLPSFRLWADIRSSSHTSKSICIRNIIKTKNNYVFPQCAELAERLEEGDIFPPVEEIVCPLLFGAALHIQVTIIMVRCVFCHIGDFLSN